MDYKNINFLNLKTNHIKSMIVSLIIALSCLFNSNTILGQERETVSDFYEYANRDWIKNTTVPENVSVVNNWGILWNKIIEKSIEILSSESN